MHLSPHFTLREFTGSQLAARYGIDNTPPADAITRLKRTAQGLEAVRVRLGMVPIHISSGFRCLALNRLLKSADTSSHRLGEAADFAAARYGPPIDIAAALLDSGIEYDQLILEYPECDGGWVHISFNAAPRHMALQLDQAGTRPIFT